jgi:hypothetical protein
MLDISRGLVSAQLSENPTYLNNFRFWAVERSCLKHDTEEVEDNQRTETFSTTVP